MGPLAMLRRRAEVENLAGDVEVLGAGPKCLLGDVLCGQGEATPELENPRHHFTLFPRTPQHANCSSHLGVFSKLALLCPN